MSDIYADAYLYDAFFGAVGSGEELEYWKRQLQGRIEPVLELACGTGRLTLPLASAGIDIAGLDLSTIMLAAAREKSDKQSLNVLWHEADCRHFDLGKRFGTIFLPNNSIAHLLHRRDLERCLACVRRHLLPNGRFLLDYFVPSMSLLNRDPETRSPVGELVNPNDGNKVVLTEQTRYDPSTQINHIQWFWQVESTSREIVSDFTMRSYFQQELDALLEYNHFEVTLKYGNYDLSPFDCNSFKQLIVATVSAE